jgi:hypothetical protein
VAPWTLGTEPAFWVEAALAAEGAEKWAEAELMKRS